VPFNQSLDKFPCEDIGAILMNNLRRGIFTEKPVLVVEDQPINQIVVEKYLSRLGFKCQVVADGRAAFHEATSGRYSLVLMDCKMQPIDGYEATKLIRVHEKTGDSRIPIIALTADGSNQDRKKCEDVGMDDYITKPIDIDELKSKIHNWILPVLNGESLKKLDGYEMEGRPLVEVLAEDYFFSAPALLNQLENSIKNLDVKQVQYFSHSLKSSSITLGLNEVCFHCQKLESIEIIKDDSLGILQDIKLSFDRSESLFKKKNIKNLPSES
jgi:CheY-like chemotaxis protein